MKVSILKTLSLIPAFIFGLPSNMIGLLILFLLIDTVTGVILSVVVDGKHSIQSRIGTTGILSKGLVILVPLMLASLSQVSEYNFIILAKGMLGMFLLFELYSTINNIVSIRLKRRLPEIDGMSWLLGQVQKGLLKMTGYKGDIKK